MNKMYIAGSKEYNTPENPVNAPIFRRKFVYNKGGKAEAIKLKIASTGFYRLFLNGKEITKGYLAPYIANPNDFVYCDEYYIGDVLINGENVVYIMLGNGFANSNDCNIWGFESASYRAAPRFALEIVKNDEKILVSDEEFEVCDSPIFFDDYRCGEFYDARLEGAECDGFFTEKNLRKAIVCEPPKGEERLCSAQPIKDFERIKPVSVKAVNGGFIYDFGVNFAGIAEVDVVGKRGEKIDLTFGEVLQNGELDISNICFAGISRKGYVQHDIYICKDGKQKWKPSFTYHGFQYVYVQGITKEQATSDFLTFVVLHSDVPVRGEFHCDNEVFNKIQECTVRSDLSNFYYFPTDCPHREKNGWTGDAAVSAEQFLYNFDCEASLREWLANIRKAQKESGELPGIVPTDGWGFEWGNGPVWDNALIELTYQLYRFGGSTEILRENASAIAKYIGYLYTKINEYGLVGFGLGDWCESGALKSDLYSTPVEVTDTLTCIELARKAEQIFAVVGDVKNRDNAKKLHHMLAENFKGRWIKGNTVICETQTAQSFAVELGLFDSDEGAYRELLNIIARDGRIKTGIVGIKKLLDCLGNHGDGETAYKLITDTSAPGYAHNLKAGATTLWEDFHLYDFSAFPDSLVRKDGEGMLSRNHHFWGSISGWFYSHVAGLDIKAANFAEISPSYIDDLDFAEAEFSRGEKIIRVRWERKPGEIFLNVENRGFCGKIHGEIEYELSEGTNTYKIRLRKKADV